MYNSKCKDDIELFKAFLLKKNNSISISVSFGLYFFNFFTTNLNYIL
jgi:hypothetical protein